ncbi:chloride channel protein, CIC family [Pseudomonas pohangensis]|uniref:Chloride channel protein, CIC family n=1 Tax=Pseudomonas pohangensis TaxID=364197 RepID=A0A1H2GPA8_9PSED|nr:ClC family H(+)/Cl(-) exchange transporter [Pseudomonas pohangensis]SDU21335.1 chloride channel protein, CIC family [Pseudomonas pohangensis]
MFRTDNQDDQDDLGGIFRLGLLATAAAVAIGLVGGLFRLSLEHSIVWLQSIYLSLRGMQPLIGFSLMCLLVTAMTLCAIYLVRRFAPNAAGSGVPRVEAVWRREMPSESNWMFLPVKFCSGILALSSGYALGREGPIVQMGAYIGGVFGKLSKSAADQRTLIAGLAGAGLAVAFSAPLGGMLFALEELTRRAHPRLVIVSMVACTTAVPVAQLLVGTGEIFPVPHLEQPGIAGLLLLACLGVASGFAGVLYNTVILRALDIFNRPAAVPLWLRGTLAAVGLSILLWQTPFFTGGGEALVRELLSGQQLFAGLAALWLARFALGPLSYSLGMSGGLFAPMLAVGAIQGIGFGMLVDAYWPAVALEIPLCAVVGMAAMFSGSVRAPLTGIVLIIEMTGLGNQAVSLMAACIPAAIIPFWLQQAGIYDDLRERLLRAQH